MRDNTGFWYELLSNGNLASFLFNEKKPNWKQGLQIAFGSARGPLYLHEESYTQLIHCDIKPQNRLLDECHNAIISDFRLAKLLLVNQSGTETGIRGTNNEEGYANARRNSSCYNSPNTFILLVMLTLADINLVCASLSTCCWLLLLHVFLSYLLVSSAIKISFLLLFIQKT